MFDICSTQFFRETADSIKMVLQEKLTTAKKQSSNTDLVCYGLGNFMDSYIARYQLALLLALREELQIVEGCCEIYDPQFVPEEGALLSELNFTVLQHNQEGKRECIEDRITVFYMPHCGKALYNNVLWRNWGQRLENIIVIGNSFTHMIENTPSRILESTANYVIKIQPYTQETLLQVPSQYEDVFNDTSIHTFRSHDLQNVPENFWQNCPEPVYDPSDAEIIFS
ncbi:SRR1-like protein isoform X2 [Ruditapes philippinarum]|uniref:SRR1-like protein isoform X2 n=1 Tax=Ruditapes philippinarum TaxID=129788 RepID=UPI00295B19FC|nr:SRR1-like protein isoform X2 [Ruditapes philippinarum]